MSARERRIALYKSDQQQNKTKKHALPLSYSRDVKREVTV